MLRDESGFSGIRWPSPPYTEVTVPLSHTQLFAFMGALTLRTSCTLLLFLTYTYNLPLLPFPTLKEKEFQGAHWVKYTGNKLISRRVINRREGMEPGTDCQTKVPQSKMIKESNALMKHSNALDG